MKKQILSVVATLTLIIPMAIIGFASLNTRVRADIPFDFQVGGKEFKAGEYSFGRVFANNPVGGMIIRNADNGEAANFNVNSVFDKGEPHARLVFRRYGNQSFLAKIFDGESGLGYELVKSKAERELAKKRDIITQNIVKPEIVTVVAQIGQ